MILVLDILCHVKQGGTRTSPDSQILLRELAGLMSSQLRNPRLPGTMRTWAIVVVELHAMTEQFGSIPQSIIGSSETSGNWQISDTGRLYSFPINQMGTSPIELITSNDFNLAHAPIAAGMDNKMWTTVSRHK
ncbi:hypothetical protein AJ78_06334 [Emergomyces pasteurianus Ep9510]|uniref:Uncharacterized protein n=1 Tax=Emergomyces pasteurianus Ep9510 TaxID=1447872 RepID=A0A1J9QAK3_9EURO|nr:hypothetical protein AJ78_06334 [Emergomyces pasteurianus Ep9510]